MLDRVRREQLERDRDVAEGQVEVDQAHLPGAVVGQREREVDRDRGLADAALGREDRDHVAVVLRGLGAAERLRERVGAGDSPGDQVQVVHGHDLTRTRLHGPGEQCGVEGGSHEDDAGGRPRDAQALADGHAVAERDVRPQHHDVLLGVLGQPRQQSLGGVHRLAARGQRTEQPPGCRAVGIDDDGHVSSLAEEGLDQGGRSRRRA